MSARTEEDGILLNVNFTLESSIEHSVICILINDQLKIDNHILMLDQQLHGLITKIIQDKNLFVGKFGQSKILTTTDKKGEVKHLILIGIGDENKLTEANIEELGGKTYTCAKLLKADSVYIDFNGKIGIFENNYAASLIVGGAFLASYTFDKYFTKKSKEEKFKVKDLLILTDNIEKSEKYFIEKKATAFGVFLARDCISEPANILYPESYGQIIVEQLEHIGVEVEILGEREMRNLGMGALLGVGQGSQNESKLVIMKYNGGDKETPPLALVGKGVTFDSGGISLKPSAGMADMKYDMAGSAAIVGLMQTLALRGAKVNVVGVVGLVENMPGGNAQKPSDVVTTMSGQTAEVLDTDAEGRLVLADAIWYAQVKFNPKIVIDLATLTGAIVIALGNTYAGLFSNEDDLANKLIKAGEKTGEKLWRMPLHKDYDEMIKSDIADVANIGNVRGAAGSSTAAHFIKRFVKEEVKWAHLDIAGKAWDKKGSAICPKGAVGYGVRLLNQFIQDNYEN